MSLRVRVCHHSPNTAAPILLFSGAVDDVGQVIALRLVAALSDRCLSRKRPDQLDHCQGVEGTIREELLLALLAA